MCSTCTGVTILAHKQASQSSVLSLLVAGLKAKKASLGTSKQSSQLDHPLEESLDLVTEDLSGSDADAALSEGSSDEESEEADLGSSDEEQQPKKGVLQGTNIIIKTEFTDPVLGTTSPTHVIQNLASKCLAYKFALLCRNR